MTKIQIIVCNFDHPTDCFPLWSNLCIKCDDYYFPSSNWNDAMSSILTMWAEQINRLLLGSSTQAVLSFMDGDYSISLTSSSRVGAYADFLHPQGSMKINGIIDLVYLARQILAAVEKAKTHCAKHRNEQTIRELIFAADKLRATLKQMSHQ